MRYDAFRDRWQEALRTAHLLHNRPEETIDLSTLARRWRVHLLSQPVAPLHAGATLSFHWDAVESARSYTCEEDLLTELFGRTRPARSTQRRLLRLDITFRAALQYGSTTSMPARDVWVPWVASMEEKLDAALAEGRRRKAAGVHAWRGELEIEGSSGSGGEFLFHGMSLSAFEMIAVTRVWDDPKRRAKEPSADRQIDGLARRFREGVDAWIASVGELVRWMRHAPGRPRATSHRTRRGESFPATETPAPRPRIDTRMRPAPSVRVRASATRNVARGRASPSLRQTATTLLPFRPIFADPRRHRRKRRRCLRRV